MNATRIFGNNCEFNYKNSASPTLCIKVRNTIITPRITQILGMTNHTGNHQINKNKIKKEKMNPMTGKKSSEYWVKMLSDIGKKGYKNPFLTQSIPFGDIITENDFIKYPPGSINTNYKKIF